MITQDITNVLKHVGYGIGFIIGTAGLPLEAFTIFGLLIILDVLTGVIRAGVVHGWRHVTSSKLTSGLVSKLLVILIPLVIAWAGKGSGVQLTFLAEGALSVFILAEAYSVLGNIHSIRIKKDVKEYDAVAYILNKIRTVMEKYFESVGKTKE